MSLLDDQQICERALQPDLPVVAAIGHNVDKQFLSKIADKSFSTPAAFGSFLEQIVLNDQNRKSQIWQLENEITLQRKTFKKELSDAKQKFKIKLKSTKRNAILTTLSIVIIILTAILLIYLRFPILG